MSHEKPTLKSTRVPHVEGWWGDLPDEPSERCKTWVRRIKAGWAPNRRIRCMGYYGSAEWYGVWIEEYLSIISPLVDGEIPEVVSSLRAVGQRKPLPRAYRELVNESPSH